jgi:hypothetical protein
VRFQQLRRSSQGFTGFSPSVLSYKFVKKAARFLYTGFDALWRRLPLRTGRPKLPLQLLPADKEKPLLLARRPKTAQRVALRSKIVLKAVEGRSHQEIARALGITCATVGKWREGFRLQGQCRR